MSQVLLIGIGGLDADLLRVYGPSLPNLRRLMLESPFLELNSTVPPEPVPAWTSVYTGLNPANHGMLANMDCLERVIPDVGLFHEELFWERAACAGKRVCVLNPLLNTTQALDGLMLIPSTPYPCEMHGETGQLVNEAFPPLLDEPLIPPASQLATFCDTLRQRTETQAATGLELLRREPWDLFYIQFDALDHVEHFLWRYSDPGDPMYPGKNEHANRILEFYQLFDKIVGRFRAAIDGSEYVLGIISSHGHERRCIYRLHVNEWLREQNFLLSLDRAQATSKTGPLKGSARLKTICSSLAQYLPWNKDTSNKRHCIDAQRTVAQLVELASATSSYGGITINRDLLEREERSYDLVCEAIVTGLERLCSQENPIVVWAKRREECYQGKYLERYPDIIFELRGDFGVGRSLNTPLIIPDSTHRLISGTHSSHGVFLLENWPAEIEVYEDFQPPSVMDVAPTILHLLELDHATLDGQALVRPCPVRQLI